jgi:hypothetical protein
LMSMPASLHGAFCLPCRGLLYFFQERPHSALR